MSSVSRVGQGSSVAPTDALGDAVDEELAAAHKARKAQKIANVQAVAHSALDLGATATKAVVAALNPPVGVAAAPVIDASVNAAKPHVSRSVQNSFGQTD